MIHFSRNKCVKKSNESHTKCPYIVDKFFFETQDIVYRYSVTGVKKADFCPFIQFGERKLSTILSTTSCVMKKVEHFILTLPPKNRHTVFRVVWWNFPLNGFAKKKQQVVS